MNESKDLDFGERRVQKVRHSYLIIIPKALASVVGIKEGDSIRFFLTEDGKLVLRPEGYEGRVTVPTRVARGNREAKGYAQGAEEEGKRGAMLLRKIARVFKGENEKPSERGI